MENILDTTTVMAQARLHPRLEIAVKKANDTNQLTPLIKEELRLSILNRRLVSGKDEIVLTEHKPQPKRELSSEEVRKKERRKEQNRRAAQTCRKKKKMLESRVVEEYFREQKKMADLQAEIDLLNQEKANLARVLDEHGFQCHRAVTPTSEPSPTPSLMELALSAETGDPFDDCAFTSGLQMHCATPSMPTKNTTAASTVTFPDFLPEIDIGPEFFEPCSPELMLGRQSISEYLDNNELLDLQP